MNCTGLPTTLDYESPWGLLLTEAKDVAGGSEDDRFTEYKYGDANEKTQQTKKTVKLYTDGSGGPLEQTAYGYNLQGRMSVVEIDSDGNGDLESRLEYEYNDHGIRTSQTETTDTDEDGELGDETPQRTDYLLDEHNPTGYAQVLEEWLDGTLSKTYTIGHDVFAEAAAAGVVRRLLKDGHGSTRMLVDAAGLPLNGQIYRFDAYGNAIGFDPALALTTLLYNAEQFDWRTGLTYLRARYYDLTTGRFNRLDPFFGNLNDPQSLHKYLFTHGDPVNGIDPTGMWGSVKMAITLGIIGAVAGMTAGWYYGNSVGHVALGGGIGLLAGAAAGGLGIGAVGTAVGVYAVAWALLDLGFWVWNHNWRDSLSGDGGYDVTDRITDALDDYGTKFSAKNLSEQAKIAGAMRRPYGWDIVDFRKWESKRTYFKLPTSADYCDYTVTIQGHVYLTYEANYVLFGYANGLAYKNGLDPVKYSKTSTALSVTVWKHLYFWDTGTQHLPASVRWAEAGWDYAQTGVFTPPTDFALANCKATSLPFPGSLSGHVGDDGNHDIQFAPPIP